MDGLQFLKRHNLKIRHFYGETFSIKKNDFKSEFFEIQSLIDKYGEVNTFYMDETGLFYKTIPSKGVCNEIRKG